MAEDTAMFADDVKFEPYWWEEAPRPALAERPLPERAEVAIVGSGYTGLSAALTLVRAGREVVVLEAGEAGMGASSRNGGMCGDSLKIDFGTLRRRHGHARAAALVREGQAALEYIAQLIESEQIECAFRRTGRFTGAHKPGRYEVGVRLRDLHGAPGRAARRDRHRPLLRRPGDDPPWRPATRPLSPGAP
jgi:glycine/D-amino acid oxidase-like deaminating enzyme